MATYEIIRETHGEATCLATTLGGQRWWITRTAVAKARPALAALLSRLGVSSRRATVPATASAPIL